ncbi:acetyltransferase, ribosomal protein N-acetylase [Anopheles sinensis]|uniref:Acetyltransferase, ribosomal protein N-acetylase n=1 Tax=Anopheles sinensis TaxID=74873 RepID=A0A084WMY8_ANOSI|nr:acetyltransferase, ribosomal protein N-acetylase [Anopheles sinensis]
MNYYTNNRHCRADWHTGSHPKPGEDVLYSPSRKDKNPVLIRRPDVVHVKVCRVTTSGDEEQKWRINEPTKGREINFCQEPSTDRSFCGRNVSRECRKFETGNPKKKKSFNSRTSFAAQQFGCKSLKPLGANGR